MKGQIALSQAVLQAKDATIESLQLTNFQYRQLLNDKPVETKRTEEDIIPGVVSVGKFKWNGLTFDFAEIIRTLKRKKHQ